MINAFNIRVYGILINRENQVLISDELIKGHRITKFPGGGLEFGEGTIDCIKREFIEETGNQIEIVNHYYTTDFFQQSAYNNQHQIISIYYLVKPKGEFVLNTSNNPFDFEDTINHPQSFRWKNLKTINEDDFTLPIDKVVGKMLRTINEI